MLGNVVMNSCLRPLNKEIENNNQWLAKAGSSSISLPRDHHNINAILWQKDHMKQKKCHEGEMCKRPHIE